MISRKHPLIVSIHILTLLARVSPTWWGRGVSNSTPPYVCHGVFTQVNAAVSGTAILCWSTTVYFCLKFYALQCASFAVCTWPVARVIRSQVKMKAGPKGQLIIYSYQGKKLSLKTAGLCFHTVICCFWRFCLYIELHIADNSGQTKKKKLNLSWCWK